jgi:hypothetical protein
VEAGGKRAKTPSLCNSDGIALLGGGRNVDTFHYGMRNSGHIRRVPLLALDCFLKISQSYVDSFLKGDWLAINAIFLLMAIHKQGV